MPFVALSLPDSPTGAAPTELAALLLAIAPRVAIATEERLAWLDGRGLDAVALAQRALAVLAEHAIPSSRAAIAGVPIVAAIAVRTASDRLTQIPAGQERAWLASRPLTVLDPPGRLEHLLTSVGITSCGGFAALDHTAVEVRFGREGLDCWHLARAQDPRPIFGARPRELPTASLDWTEFATADLERLVFVLNALLGTVCTALTTTGLGARALALTLSLEGGTQLTAPVGAARPTADRRTWLRLVRRALERITLDDRVAGIALQVTAASQPPSRQGDLFDAGFASATAAERAVADVLDLQHDAMVEARRTVDLLPERRVRWGAEQEMSFSPAAVHDHAGDAALALTLLPAPREITVRTRPRRGFAVPVRYLDNGTALPLREALGPQCLSGHQWEMAFAREYYQAVRADGTLVLLFRDGARDHWYLAGWWD
ncbi:MAG TPA: hypothetical protein VHW65_03830 [Gemmatimonadales bacterium]|jgi:protein ImuB|nr:hypothetical protein [Gemmatimonadales bacterium]